MCMWRRVINVMNDVNCKRILLINEEINAVM